MSGEIRNQSGWEETDEEVELRRKLAKSGDTGWTGTIVGLVLALAALAAIALTH